MVLSSQELLCVSYFVPIILCVFFVVVVVFFIVHQAKGDKITRSPSEALATLFFEVSHPLSSLLGHTLFFGHDLSQHHAVSCFQQKIADRGAFLQNLDFSFFFVLWKGSNEHDQTLTKHTDELVHTIFG